MWFSGEIACHIVSVWTAVCVTDVVLLWITSAVSSLACVNGRDCACPTCAQIGCVACRHFRQTLFSLLEINTRLFSLPNLNNNIRRKKGASSTCDGYKLYLHMRWDVTHFWSINDLCWSLSNYTFCHKDEIDEIWLCERMLYLWALWFTGIQGMFAALTPWRIR